MTVSNRSRREEKSAVSLDVDVLHREVRLGRGEIAQVVDVVGIDVARHPGVPRQEPDGDVADAGADLEHLRADMRANLVRHPAVEATRLLEAGEDVRAVLVRGVGVVDQPEAEHGGDRLPSVPPADLLAFELGPPEIADRHLEDPETALGDLGGDLGLERKVVRAQRKRLQELGAEDLVAGLHVGQVEIGEEVAHPGEEPVDSRMAVVQHPPAVGGEKARAVDHIGAVLEKRPYEARIVPRVVLEIGVLEERQVAGRGGDAGAYGGAFALVVRVLEVAQPRLFGRQLAQDLACAVGGAVVDDHHLELGEAGVLDSQDPGQQVAHQVAFVVDRHDHAEFHRHRPRRWPGRRER